MLDSPDHSLFVYNKYLDKEADYQAMSHESFSWFHHSVFFIRLFLCGGTLQYM